MPADKRVTRAVLEHHPRRAPWKCLKQNRSPIRVVYSSIDVKTWKKRMPSVDAVRPPYCPACEAPGAPAGGRRGLHGHGIRGRVQLGADDHRGEPRVGGVEVRRYRCRHCRAVITVCPRGVLRLRRYAAAAIALALALWSEPEQSSAQVRARVSPHRIVSSEGARGWRSVRRWARARIWPRLRHRASTGRHAASEVAQQLAARAPLPTGVLVADACVGAMHTDGHRGCTAGSEVPTT